jgi:uncharacterized protein (DUF736 family)
MGTLAGGRGKRNLAGDYFPLAEGDHSSRNKITAGFGPTLRYGRERCASPSHRPVSCHRGRSAARSSGVFPHGNDDWHFHESRRQNYRQNPHPHPQRGTDVPAQRNPTSADAPAYRIFGSDRAELGAAWEKTAEATGRKYLSVRLDDPTFAGPLYASLLEQEDGTHNLIWNRRT